MSTIDTSPSDNARRSPSYCRVTFDHPAINTISQFEVGIGVPPGGGPMARLPRLVGRGRLIADDQLDAEVDAIASRLARFDHDAIARTKSYVDQVTLPAESELERSLGRRVVESTPDG